MDLQFNSGFARRSKEVSCGSNTSLFLRGKPSVGIESAARSVKLLLTRSSSVIYNLTKVRRERNKDGKVEKRSR